MARDTKKTDPKAIFSLWMPRRKSPIFKLPVLIQFQVAADNGEGIVYGGYQRGDARRPAGAVSQDSVAKQGRQHPLGVWDEPCLSPRAGGVLARWLRLATPGADDQRLLPLSRDDRWGPPPLHSPTRPWPQAPASHPHPRLALHVLGSAQGDPPPQRS